jgi:hypothetical protein
MLVGEQMKKYFYCASHGANLIPVLVYNRGDFAMLTQKKTAAKSTNIF